MTGIDRDLAQHIQVAAGQIPAGSLVDGRFEVESYLGTGGMCDVYKARHRQMDKAVALKLLKPALCTVQSSVERFLREAKTLSTIHHRNVVEVYSVGVYNNRPFIAMEFLDGTSLAQTLLEQPQRRLAQQQALPIFLQICDGLAHCHAAGILHRDLKPSNVMLVDGGATVKVVDFGIAKVLPQSGKDIERLTQSGALLGSLHYMSPEQCTGGQLDERSDIYSLGCLMYETLVGDVPFTAVNPFAVLSKHVSQEPQRNPLLNNAVGAVVMSTMAKDPADRPPSLDRLKGLLVNPPVLQMQFQFNRIHGAITFACLAGLIGIALVFAQTGSEKSAFRQSKKIAAQLRPIPPNLRDGIQQNYKQGRAELDGSPSRPSQAVQSFHRAFIIANGLGPEHQDIIDLTKAWEGFARERDGDHGGAIQLCLQVMRCQPGKVPERELLSAAEAEAVNTALKCLPMACSGGDWKASIKWRIAYRDFEIRQKNPNEALNAQLGIAQECSIAGQYDNAIEYFNDLHNLTKKTEAADVTKRDYDFFYAHANVGLGDIYLRRSKIETGEAKLADLKAAIDHLTPVAQQNRSDFQYRAAQKLLAEALRDQKLAQQHK